MFRQVNPKTWSAIKSLTMLWNGMLYTNFKVEIGFYIFLSNFNFGQVLIPIKLFLLNKINQMVSRECYCANIFSKFMVFNSNLSMLKGENT